MLLRHNFQIIRIYDVNTWRRITCGMQVFKQWCDRWVRSLGIAIHILRCRSIRISRTVTSGKLQFQRPKMRRKRRKWTANVQ